MPHKRAVIAPGAVESSAQQDLARAERAHRAAVRGIRLMAEQRQANARAAETRRTVGWIYFIRQDAPAGLVKIGFTRRPVLERLRELQTAQPCALVLLATCSGTMAVERKLHARFAALRERGEWFRPGEDLMNYIRVSAGNGGSNAVGG